MRLELRGAGLLRGDASGRARLGLLPTRLEFTPGEHVALVGPSGAGKTTLLQLAACAVRPDRGQVLWDDEDPWALPSRQRRQRRANIIFAPQLPPLPPRQRVVTAVLAARLPQMGFWRSLRSWIHPMEAHSAQEALARFGLGPRLFDRVDRLSGGERQRVSLARVLLAPASLWLLDEPLSALDPVWAAQALAILRDEAQRCGATLIISTHQAELARASFPRLVGLRAGSVVFDRAAADLDSQQWLRLYEPSEGARPVEDEAPAAATAVAAHLPWR